MLRRPTPAWLGLLISILLTTPSPAQDGPIGFLPGSRAAEAKAEAQAVAIPTPDAARPGSGP